MQAVVTDGFTANRLKNKVRLLTCLRYMKLLIRLAPHSLYNRLVCVYFTKPYPARDHTSSLASYPTIMTCSNGAIHRLEEPSSASDGEL